MNSSLASCPSDIPGYIWDPIRSRYFKIVSDQHGQNAGCITKSLLKQKEDESRRNRYLAIPRGKSARGNFTEKIIRCDISNRGESYLTLKRLLAEEKVSNIDRRSTEVFKVLGDLRTTEDVLESCQFLTSGCHGKTILELTPTQNYVYAMDPYVTDFCKAPVDSSVTCVLYATTPLLPNLGGRVFFQPVPELCRIDDVDFLESPVYNMHWTLKQGVWSCAWNSSKMRVGLGLETCGLIVDVVAEKEFHLNSRRKNILAQQFYKDGNVLLFGLRGADILCSDLRLSSRRTVNSLSQKSTHWFSLLHDSNFLISANFHGEIKLWDLRMCKAVYGFSGHQNSHSRVSCVVDDAEQLLFAGEDGMTRGWSLKSGDLLCAIPSPYPVTERSTVPRICYANSWAGLNGTAALILGVRDELHSYELHL